MVVALFNLRDAAQVLFCCWCACVLLLMEVSDDALLAWAHAVDDSDASDASDVCGPQSLVAGGDSPADVGDVAGALVADHVPAGVVVPWQQCSLQLAQGLDAYESGVLIKKR